MKIRYQSYVENPSSEPGKHLWISTFDEWGNSAGQDHHRQLQWVAVPPRDDDTEPNLKLPILPVPTYVLHCPHIRQWFEASSDIRSNTVGSGLDKSAITNTLSCSAISILTASPSGNSSTMSPWWSQSTRRRVPLPPDPRGRDGNFWLATGKQFPTF